MNEELLPALALDDVYIGGSEINAYELFDDFENTGTESTNWWFGPYSKVCIFIKDLKLVMHHRSI